jgi:iron complex outermembrane receptor protein
MTDFSALPILQYSTQVSIGLRRAKQSVPHHVRSASCAMTIVLATLGMQAARAETAQAVSPNELASAANGSSTATDTLSEVIVTAEHFTSNVQKTPIAMSVYEGTELAREGVVDIQDLTVVSPYVNFAVTEADPMITIRGISSRDVTSAGDPAVSVNTDGFYLNRPYDLDVGMYDIDRIEVLRGPQGTLNGRNSVGGSINIVTAKPTTTESVSVSLAYGSYNELNLQGMANIPITDVLQLRLSFLSESHDGYRNNYPERNADDADNKSGRLSIAFEPIEHFQGLITAQYSTIGGAGDSPENIPFQYTASGALIHALPAGISSTTYPLYTQPTETLRAQTIRYNLSYDFGGVQLTALGGYDKTYFEHGTDQSTPLQTYFPVREFIERDNVDTTNAELRLASTSDGPLQWQVGTFYFKETDVSFASNDSPLPTGLPDYWFGFVQTNYATSEAVYAQASYAITSALKLTAGARYTHDQKSQTGYDGDISAEGPFTPDGGSTSSSKSTFHGGLDYNLTSSSLLYAKVDTGYKAGGYNDGATAYKPETVTAYEIGSKNWLLDRTLQLNVDVFYEKYLDQQVPTFIFLPNGKPIQLTENAGASRNYGVETDLVYINPLLGTFNAGVSYLNARYTNFLSAPDPSDPTAGTANVQLAGNTLPNSPTWGLGIGYQRKWDVSAGLVSLHVDSKIQTSQYFSFYNFADTQQKAYTMSNAQLSFEPAGKHLTVSAYVKNIENRAVFTNATEDEYAYAYTYQFDPPRTFGVRLNYAY